MTETLLQQLEEKMMALLSEVELLRREVSVLRLENANHKMNQDKHTKKVQDILALLDAVNVVDNPILHPATVTLQPVMVQNTL